MCSKSAKYRMLFNYDFPEDIVKEVARQHKQRNRFDQEGVTADYYWMPLSKALFVVIDGKNTVHFYGYHHDVAFWDWDRMIKLEI